MSRHTGFAIGGVIVGLILLAWLPWYVSALIIIAAIAIPTTAYLMLDPSQRRRLREARRRGQLGR
jgi:asparagine N-glycosylation enzyme membrane subunit Stt3